MNEFKPQAATLIVFILFGIFSPAKLSASVIIVGPDETNTTIADGIDAAFLQPEKEVFIKAGVYNENVELQDGIKIVGEEAARVIIDGNFSGSNGTMITAAPNVVIQNLTIRNGDVGIDATGFGEVLITNNLIVSNADFGIRCDNASTNIQIINNVIAFTANGVNGTGISCTTTGSVLTNITIENNAITNNEIGISNSLGSFINAVINFNNFSDNSTTDGERGTNDITGDPEFADPTNNDYHLQAGSACLDEGDPASSFDDASVSSDHSQNDCGAYGGPSRDVTPFQVQNAAPITPVLDYTIALEWNANLAYDIADYKIYFDNRTHTITDNVPSPLYGRSLTVAATNTNCPAGPVPPVCSTTISVALAAPHLTVTFGDQELFLNWSVPQQNRGLSVKYNVFYSVHDLNTWTQIPNVSGTEYTLSGLVNGAPGYDVQVTAILETETFYFNITALDDFDPAHESFFLDPDVIPISTTLTCSKPFCESPDSNIAHGTPEPIVPFPDLPDQGRCFIATAAYGSPWEPHVRTLRAFRDEYLEKHDLGRRFIAWYYHHSPPWAQYLNEHPGLKPAVRVALMPAVGLAYFYVETTTIQRLILLLLMASLAGWFLIMKKINRGRQ